MSNKFKLSIIILVLSLGLLSYAIYKQVGDPEVIKSFELYEESAQQGDADAQYYLGRMYVKGRSVQQDDVKAFEWFEKSAQQGHVFAQYNLGAMYDEGRGVQQDDVKAFEW